MRRQVEPTLRFMRLRPPSGCVVILALIAVLSDIRGVLILVGDRLPADLARRLLVGCAAA